MIKIKIEAIASKSGREKRNANSRFMVIRVNPSLCLLYSNFNPKFEVHYTKTSKSSLQVLYLD